MTEGDAVDFMLFISSNTLLATIAYTSTLTVCKTISSGLPTTVTHTWVAEYVHGNEFGVW